MPPDKVPRPSISNIIWTLSSDTICQPNQLFSNSEVAMLSTHPFRGSPERQQTIFCLRISENESTGVQFTSAVFCMAGKKSKVQWILMFIYIYSDRKSIYSHNYFWNYCAFFMVNNM